LFGGQHRIIGESFVIHTAFNDAGISGAKGRKDRPGLDDMLKQAQRGKFDVVMAWAIDRVGRSLIDLLGTIQHLEACKVDLYLDQQQIDTTTPSGRLLFQVTGAFGEFERSMIRERVNAGLARAKAQCKTLGRPKNNNPKQRAAVVQLRKRGRGNQYLRRLLINGASANLLRSKATNADPWIIGLRRQRPNLVVAVERRRELQDQRWFVFSGHPRRATKGAPYRKGIAVRRGSMEQY
jgi:DNA invertase Pin-like site-specific DNA recombinase